MAVVKAGDRVKIAARNVTSDDSKTGLYYEYFGGLTGTVDRVYEDQSVCVDIDLDSLQESARERHLAMQEAERTRWLESLSQDVRSRLTSEQQKLTMSYKILVSKKDLEVLAGAKPSKSKPAPAAVEKPKKAPEPQKPAPTPKREKKPPTKEPKRLSAADLDAAEEAMLQAAQKKK